MSGETEDQPFGWTLDTLSAHLTKLLENRASREDVAVLKAMVESMTDLTEAKFVTFRVLVESQAEKVALALTASKEAIDKAEIATSKAIDKAEIANDKRFEAVNEFRDSLSDQQATYITRQEALAAIGRNAERIADLSARLDRAEGRT